MSSLRERISEDEYQLCLDYLSLFKIEGQPASELATEGQIEIFHAIIFRDSKRLEILCSTQYGKSLFVALACIILTCILKEMVAIIAPTNEKAKIIMRYYIEHLGDSPNFAQTLEKNTRLDRLRLEESKERIMLNNGGGIFVLSANSGSTKGIEAAMGAGAKNVILDEAGLVPDIIEATIFRMIAGKGPEAFYCKIGNPWYRNHFLASWINPSYKKIFIDYQRGLEEGRYTQEFIEEAKDKPHFDILFGCLFPDEDTVDDKGYISLFSSKVIDAAQKLVVQPFGEKRLGVDVAEGGGDFNAFVLRWKNYMKVLKKFINPNGIQVAAEVKQVCNDEDVVDRNVFLDTIGIGQTVYQPLVEQKWYPTSVKFSTKASNEEEFYNRRAECYWHFAKWLREGGALEPSQEWQQLLVVKYKIVNGRILIKPKEEIRKELKFSPDVPDAAAMTFDRPAHAIISKSTEQRREEKEIVKQFDANRMKKRLIGPVNLRGRRLR